MYKIKDIVYADAGKVLVGNGKKGYQFSGEMMDFTEEEISLEEIVRNAEMGIVEYGGIVQAYNPNETYANIKADMVHRRYSPDDQTAIILNKDSDDVAYERMQQWRNWSSKVAHAIIGDSEQLMVAKNLKFADIAEYDNSAAVNEFYCNNIPMWLDKDTRNGLLTRFNAEKAAGIESTTLWYGTQSFTLTVDKGIEMMNAIELYASACYDNTAEHKANVMALEDTEEVNNYNYTVNYPEKLHFNLKVVHA